MVEVGDIALKIAGRDAGKLCVVIDVMNNNFVLIDGETRKRKCNPKHLEFLNKKIKVRKGATTDDVREALKEAGFVIKEVKKGKKKESKPRLSKIRKTKKHEPSETSKAKDKKK